MSSDASAASRRTNSWRVWLDAVTTFVMLAAAGGLIWTQFVPRPVQRASLGTSIPKDPVPFVGAERGSATAAVGILEFSDFQCPFCKTFATETLPSIEHAYIKSGQVRMVFRHLPLANHPHARPAAIAAECARRQGRFWQVHDLLYGEKRNLQELGLPQRLPDAALNTQQYANCVSVEGPNAVAQDVVAAKQLGISGTPTFLIGAVLPDGKLRVLRTMAGARPFEDFKANIESALNESRATLKTRR